MGAPYVARLGLATPCIVTRVLYEVILIRAMSIKILANVIISVRGIVSIEHNSQKATRVFRKGDVKWHGGREGSGSRGQLVRTSALQPALESIS